MTTKNEFLAALEDRSWEVRRAADGAVVLAPSPPVEADELWVPADDEAPYHDAIDELGTRDVIEFWWDDGMPASTAEIAVFDGPTRSYVSLAPDQDRDLGWLVVAALEPPRSSVAFGLFLSDFLSMNGAGYGPEIFGGLPNRIENHDTGLVTEQIVKDSIDAWLTWAAEGNRDLPDGWEPGWLDRYVAKAYKVI